MVILLESHGLALSRLVTEQGAWTRPIGGILFDDLGRKFIPMGPPATAWREWISVL